MMMGVSGRFVTKKVFIGIGEHPGRAPLVKHLHPQLEASSGHEILSRRSAKPLYRCVGEGCLGGERHFGVRPQYLMEETCEKEVR